MTPMAGVTSNIEDIPMNAPLKTTAEAATDFARRHIGPSPRDIAAMLDSVGAKSLD